MQKAVLFMPMLGAPGIAAALFMSANQVSGMTNAGTVRATSASADPAHPVVLELFQSQGCSSCPPANAVLNDIAGNPNVLALNFAVTYWDQLGWKDSFARPEFTSRQWEYAHAGGRSNVQTPQLIVDGQAALLGSYKNEVEAAIAAHRRVAGAPEISIDGNAVVVGQGKAEPAKIWLIDYDPRAVAVPIRAGENSGRTLVHRNIVRKLTALGAWTGSAARIALPAKRPELARALLLQRGVGGPVIAGRKIG